MVCIPEGWGRGGLRENSIVSVFFTYEKDIQVFRADSALGVPHKKRMDVNSERIKWGTPGRVNLVSDLGADAKVAKGILCVFSFRYLHGIYYFKSNVLYSRN